MTTPFGAQLIGETEKTLNALLLRHLDGTGLSEPQWVTMRLAQALDGKVDATGLAAEVTDRAHFPDADRTVAELTTRGVLDDGRLTDEGNELLADLQASIAGDVGAIFTELDGDDTAATERVLNELVERARVRLARA
jgi:hypothetical protein